MPRATNPYLKLHWCWKLYIHNKSNTSEDQDRCASPDTVILLIGAKKESHQPTSSEGGPLKRYAAHLAEVSMASTCWTPSIRTKTTQTLRLFRSCERSREGLSSVADTDQMTFRVSIYSADGGGEGPCLLYQQSLTCLCDCISGVKKQWRI